MRRDVPNTFEKARNPMGVFTIDYETVIRPKLDEAITNALMHEIKEAAVNAIEESAKQNIYEAYPNPKFNSRRFSAEHDASYAWDVSGNRLRIEYIAQPQNLFGGSFYSENLGDIIAEGWENWHMPFPRPWMDDGMANAINTGEIDRAIKAGLERQGF